MIKAPMGLQELRRRIYRQAKSDIGWWRWSNENLYDVLGLYWDWKLHPLPSAEQFS